MEKKGRKRRKRKDMQGRGKTCKEEVGGRDYQRKFMLPDQETGALRGYWHTAELLTHVAGLARDVPPTHEHSCIYPSPPINLI